MKRTSGLLSLENYMYDDPFGSESLRRREGLRYYATCNITADASLADYGIMYSRTEFYGLLEAENWSGVS